MNHKRTKAVVTCILVFAGSLIVIAVVALGILQIRTSNILDDYSSVYKNEKYKTPIMIDGVDVIRQDVSCGYAVLEMFSSWSGHSVTEKSLYDQCTLLSEMHPTLQKMHPAFSEMHPEKPKMHPSFFLGCIFLSKSVY